MIARATVVIAVVAAALFTAQALHQSGVIAIEVLLLGIAILVTVSIIGQVLSTKLDEIKKLLQANASTDTEEEKVHPSSS